MKYVSVFKRTGRRNWYVNFYDPATLRRRCNVRTDFEIADPQGYRKALDYANELSREARAAKVTGPTEHWSEWVDDYLSLRYRRSPASLAKARGFWAQWRAFLTQERITTLRALDYAAVMRFFSWRQAQVKRRSRRRASHNTALHNTRFMSMLLREAIRRGYATTNPCEKLGIRQDEPKEKPEITDAEIATIRAALRQEPEWMAMAFEIAIHQGCRLTETRLRRADVDFENGTITFHAKGHKVFATKLHPDLAPILRSRFADHEWTYDPVTVFSMSLQWGAFFRRAGLPHLTFHCTRVTVITRLARAGVPIQQAMAYVGHASSTIHRIYQRLKPADLTAAAAAIRV